MSAARRSGSGVLFAALYSCSEFFVDNSLVPLLRDLVATLRLSIVTLTVILLKYILLFLSLVRSSWVKYLRRLAQADESAYRIS